MLFLVHKIHVKFPPESPKSNDLALHLSNNHNFQLTFIFSLPGGELMSVAGLELELLLEQMPFISDDVKWSHWLSAEED